MIILIPLIAIFLTSISLLLISDMIEGFSSFKTSGLIQYDLRLFKVEINLKTHFNNIKYAVSPENSSSGIVASFNNFFTISRGIGQYVQTPQELITPSIIQITLTNKTI